MEDVWIWLHDALVVPSSMQTIIIISLVATIGLLLGRLKLGKLNLGVTFVFFTGIITAHFGIRTDVALTSILQSFGLILYVYALGVEVGPSFFPSLKSRGIKYNLQGLLMIGLTYILILILYYSNDISMPTLLGIMSGAVTSTPVLAAIQSTLQTSMPHAPELSTEAAMATAVAYPLGVVGVILGLMVLAKVSSYKRKGKQTEEFRDAYVAEFEILNPNTFNISIKEVAQSIDKHFIISRIWRKGELLFPTSSSALKEGDHILVLCHEEDCDELAILFGKRSDSQDWNRPDINWDAIDACLISQRIIITNPKLNGVKLGSLKLRNRFGINITRIDRIGIELLATPDLYLQTGDRLTIVGEAGAISQVEKLLGNSIAMLEKPKLVSFFFGLSLGCLLGIIPITLPGMSIPIQLGLAGGPIIVGILMGAFGPRLHLATYMTNSATQLIKQIGIILFLAGLGLNNGAGFITTLLSGNGLTWLFIGFLITTLPSFLTGLICIRILGSSYTETAGMISGTMANPFALDYATESTNSRTCSVAYATVYPVAMFVRIISTQILLLFFL